jgi:hypothetical protein
VSEWEREEKSESRPVYNEIYYNTLLGLHHLPRTIGMLKAFFFVLLALMLWGENKLFDSMGEIPSTQSHTPKSRQKPREPHRKTSFSGDLK